MAEIQKYIIEIPEVWMRRFVVIADDEAQARDLAEDFYLNFSLNEEALEDDLPEYLRDAVMLPDEETAMELWNTTPKETWNVADLEEWLEAEHDLDDDTDECKEEDCGDTCDCHGKKAKGV